MGCRAGGDGRDGAGANGGAVGCLGLPTAAGGSQRGNERRGADTRATGRSTRARVAMAGDGDTAGSEWRR
eukprot:278397-Pleurochrysis_carterae.AAC.1